MRFLSSVIFHKEYWLNNAQKPDNFFFSELHLETESEARPYLPHGFNQIIPTATYTAQKMKFSIKDFCSKSFLCSASVHKNVKHT